MSLKSFASLSCALCVLVALLTPTYTWAYEHNLEAHADPDPPLHQEEESESPFHFDDGGEGLDAFVDERHEAACAVCHQVLVPALHQAIVASNPNDHSLNLVRSVLQPLPHRFTFDVKAKKATPVDPQAAAKTPPLQTAVPPGEESDDEEYPSHEEHGVDPYIREAVEHLLWDAEMSRQVSALVRVFHELHDRQEYIDKLIEHQICACDEGNMQIQDGKFNKLLMHHSAAVEKELELHPVIHEIGLDEEIHSHYNKRQELSQKNIEVLESSAMDEM